MSSCCMEHHLRVLCAKDLKKRSKISETGKLCALDYSKARSVTKKTARRRYNFKVRFHGESSNRTKKLPS
jgi:hypothetical protein